MATITIPDKQSQPVKLSPAPLLPAASFTFANNTGVTLRITVERKHVLIEKSEG